MDTVPTNVNWDEFFCIVFVSSRSRWVLRWKNKCPKYCAVITALYISLVDYNRHCEHNFLHDQYSKVVSSRTVVFLAQCQPIFNWDDFFWIVKFVSFEMGLVLENIMLKILTCDIHLDTSLVGYNRHCKRKFLRDQYDSTITPRIVDFESQCQPIFNWDEILWIVKFVSFEIDCA